MFRKNDTGALYRGLDLERLYDAELDFEDDGTEEFEENRPSATLKANCYSVWVDGFNKFVEKNFTEFKLQLKK